MILIIRPKKDSRNLIKDLEQIDLKIHFEKFFYFKIKNFEMNFVASHFFLISSRKTIQSLKRKPLLLKKLANNGRLFVIGEKVEAELKRLKFQKIIKTFMNSKEFINYITKNFKSRTCIDHLTGSVENRQLKLFSKKTHVKMNFIETYIVKFKKFISAELKSLFRRKKINFMFHYSLKASESFYDTLSNDEKLYFKKSITHFCLSFRIKKGLADHGVDDDRLFVSKRADHHSLMLLFNNKIHQI